MEGYFTIKEASEKYIETCRSKIRTTAPKTLIRSTLAGGMIAFGAAISSVAAHTITNVAFARLASALVFPVGLMMVILFGAELFTGDCLIAMSVFDKKQKVYNCLKLLFAVYVGNFLGSVFIALLISFSGQLDYSAGLLGAYTIKIAVEKVNLTFTQGFTSGILCNILVCAAVLMAGCAKDITGKLLATFFVIMLFVTGGFEHCVANMYYITAGLLAKCNPEYLQMAMNTYGFSANTLSTLTLANFFTKNLLPVTVGNILGGSFFVGLPVYIMNYRKKK